ncbi:MAG: hypothetical protein GX771_12790 [Halomonadaceae bacterium]|nr:hypothetical protein [Halomonadaceae bacterium]
MFDPNDPRRNAAWQAAQQWRARANQSSGGALGGVKLVFTWLLFGLLLIIGTVVGLFLLLLGWALLPIMRYRMKKRFEQLRAEQAETAGGSYHYRETHFRQSRPESHKGENTLLEGEYEVRNDETRQR